MHLHEETFDLVVIGSGPGGEGAAMQAAKEGQKVAVVEKDPQIGGSCTHKGTIPSKTLRQLANRLTLAQSEGLAGASVPLTHLSFSEFLSRTKAVVKKQVRLRAGHYVRNKVTIFHGRARLLEPTSVLVSGDDQHGSLKLSCKNIILATGSRPVQPKGIDMSHPRLFDSDSILELEEDPRIITIAGAGVVGCEYTSIFRSMGTKVNLINHRDRLLSFLDNEIIDALSYHLRDRGVLIRNNETVAHVDSRTESVLVHLNSGKKIKSDIVLFALGRAGNIEDLGLEDLGIEVNSRGHVQTNNVLQTACPNIYAVGDLLGFPALASSAYDQGRFAACHVLDPNCDSSLVDDIPVGIYTSPEISCIGKTEAELTAQKVPFEVGHVAFKQLARAQITGQTDGMLKILFHTETLEILGIHCFGRNAAEIIHIGQAIMAQKNGGNSLKYFVNTTFNYPTMAEAYRVAALNGLNRLC